MDQTDAAAILLVDDEENVTAGLQRAFRAQPFRVFRASSGAAALEIMARHPIDVLVTDERMPGMSGSELLAEARRLYPATARIILSGQADLDAAIRAINEGEVWRFILKPCNAADLLLTVQRAVEHKRLLELSRRLLARHQRQAATLEDIARTNPELMSCATDDQGAILIDEDDPALALDLPELLREIEAQVGGTREALPPARARSAHR